MSRSSKHDADSTCFHITLLYRIITRLIDAGAPHGASLVDTALRRGGHTNHGLHTALLNVTIGDARGEEAGHHALASCPSPTAAATPPPSSPSPSTPNTPTKTTSTNECASSVATAAPPVTVSVPPAPRSGDPHQAPIMTGETLEQSMLDDGRHADTRYTDDGAPWAVIAAALGCSIGHANNSSGTTVTIANSSPTATG